MKLKNIVLSVKHLTKTIGKEKILNDLNFDVPEKSFCAFIGHNGAGKTTTIKSIMNLYRYRHGDITIDGISSRKISSHASIGYVPEKENFPKIPARHFLMEMGGLCDVKRSVLTSRIKYWEKIFGLQNRLHINLNSMSSGQKKKIMIIQALLHEPKLLIMDEPTENLDPDTRDIFYQVMKKLLNEGTTIFISTHNLDEIQHHANYVVIIVGGKIKKISYIKRGTNLHAIYNRFKPKVIL